MKRLQQCPRCTTKLGFDTETQTFSCEECGWRNPMEELATRRVNPFDF